MVARFIISGLILTGMLWLTYGLPEYHVGRGDVLKVEVIGEADFSGSMQVNGNGAITIKMIGEIPVTGLTQLEIKDKLTAILRKDYLVDPNVKVEVAEYKSKKIVVLGEVSKPGEYFLSKDSLTILEVISMAGGLNENIGDKISIFRKQVLPEGGTADQKAEINVQDLLGGKVKEAELQVLPDDVVNFPSRKTDTTAYQVYIEGKVKTPGIYEFHQGMTVYELCLKAGGFDQFSAENRTTIIRLEGETVQKIKANLKKIKKGDKPDIPLVPGDKVIVPGSWY